MKLPFALPNQFLALALAIVSFARVAAAQEIIDSEEAQKIAQKLATVSTASSDQPFTIDIDVQKPVGLKGGEAGLIILPDKHFSAETLASASKTVTPVGQLWMYKVNLASNGLGVDKGKLRTFTVGEGDKSRDVQLFLLGVAKTEQGATELVVYAKGGEVVLHAPLNKHFAAKKEVAIDLSGRKTGEESAALTVDFFGEYAADLTVVKLND
ncbi:MAG TPA: hypothetical protein VK961_15640 [Chthoniobacter sp.]|nr:hypothetical protein [Chthoniobacter sp.]